MVVRSCQLRAMSVTPHFVSGPSNFCVIHDTNTAGGEQMEIKLLFPKLLLSNLPRMTTTWGKRGIPPREPRVLARVSDFPPSPLAAAAPIVHGTAHTPL